ncbi:MAG: hypothetical protein LC658_03525 [Bacteroidales bacterium]|nr:hypothetical protein [Bacteroidales bacterium]
MKKLIFITFVLIPFWGFSQNFEYQVLFEGIGDNREFFSGKAMSQTILGSRGAFEVGLETDNHRIRGGLSQLLEFGSDLDYHKPSNDDRYITILPAQHRRNVWRSALGLGPPKRFC